MSTKRIKLIAYACGVIISITGLFLPWGILDLPEGAMGRAYKAVLGFEILPGALTLIGCAIIAFSLLFVTKNPGHSLKGILVGEAIIGFFSLLWIVSSSNLSWALDWSNGIPLTYRYSELWVPTYGAYISLIGAMITLVSYCILQNRAVHNF